jgi:3-oxoacyl-[acyl-carrier protein] reductase
VSKSEEVNMDLGIRGRTAIVCGATQGLGKACALALGQEGVNLVINARRSAVLEATAEEIRLATAVQVTAIAGDITTESGREAVLSACSSPDILINNAGGPPPGDFRGVDRAAWIEALDANMLTPIFLIRAVLYGMIARAFGRIINITTSGVKNPAAYPPLAVSIGVRSGLTGFVGVLSRQVAQHNVTINGLLPGQFETERLRNNLAFAASQSGRSPEEEMERARKGIPAGRFGQPGEFGAACAFLCGVQAGYITGQNIVLDGGTFPGML